MKKLLAIIFVLGLMIPSVSFGAIIFDAATSGSSAAGQTTYNLANTVTSTANTILFVGAMNATDSTDDITSVTSTVGTLTRLGTVVTTGRFLALYVITGLNSGAQSITMNTSAGHQLDMAIWSYAGAKQSVSASDFVLASSTGSGALWAQAITTAVNNSWVSSVSRFNSATAAGASTTQRIAQTNYTGVYDSSLSPITPAGSVTVNVTGGAVDYGGIAVAFKPFGVDDGVNMKIIWWD